MWRYIYTKSDKLYGHIEYLTINYYNFLCNVKGK